jgi:hypothetical protein
VLQLTVQLVPSWLRHYGALEFLRKLLLLLQPAAAAAAAALID